MSNRFRLLLLALVGLLLLGGFLREAYRTIFINPNPTAQGEAGQPRK